MFHGRAASSAVRLVADTAPPANAAMRAMIAPGLRTHPPAPPLSPWTCQLAWPSCGAPWRTSPSARQVAQPPFGTTAAISAASDAWLPDDAPNRASRSNATSTALIAPPDNCHTRLSASINVAGQKRGAPNNSGFTCPAIAAGPSAPPVPK